MNHFERLGLPADFALDTAEVERAYLAQSRALHPDFHQLSSTAEQRLSLELSAALNDAYTTLKDPFRRAEYLLALQQGPSANDHRDMDPVFLEEMLDLRMEIEELKSAGDPATPGRERMSQRLQARADKLVNELATRFAKLATLQPEDARRRTLLEIRQSLNAAKYIRGLRRDLDAD